MRVLVPCLWSGAKSRQIGAESELHVTVLRVMSAYLKIIPFLTVQKRW